MSFLKKSFFLKQLSSPSRVTLDSSFWQKSFLEEFPIPLTALDPGKVNLIIRQVYNNILVNNLTTHNLPRFLGFVTGVLTKVFELDPKADMSTQDFEIKKNNIFTNKANSNTGLRKKRKRRNSTKQKNKRRQQVAGVVDGETTLKLVNLLHLAGILCKLVMEMSISYLEGVEREKERSWIFGEHFEFPPENSRSNSIIEFKTLPTLLSVLIQIVLQLTDVRPHSNYVILMETITLILTLISGRIFSLSLSLKNVKDIHKLNESNCEENPLEAVFLKMNKHTAYKLMSILLTHAFNQNKTPVSSTMFWEKKHGGSFRRSKKKHDYIHTGNNHLSGLSLSFLLSLLQLRPITRNALFLNYVMNNIQQKKVSTEFFSFIADLVPINSKMIINEELNFNMEIFFDYFEETNNMDYQITLLFYHTINKNLNCLEFFLTNKKQMPNFILTLIRSIYDQSFNEKITNKNYQQVIDRSIYLLLSILFILAKQDKFCTFVFSVEVSNLTWLKNLSVIEESIGNIIILVICALIQVYIAKSYQPQKLKLCFGILHHFSSFIQDLSIEVSERIIKIFQILSSQLLQFLELKPEELDENQITINKEASIPIKTKAKSKTKSKTKSKKKSKKKKKKNMQSKKKIQPKIKQGDYKFCESVSWGWTNTETIYPPPSVMKRPNRLKPLYLKNHFAHFYKDLTHEIQFCTNLLVYLLDIINNNLLFRLSKNPQFIHILLKNELKFRLFLHHPRLWKYISNIQKIIKYFQRVIKKQQQQQQQQQLKQQQEHNQKQTLHLQKHTQQQVEEKTLSDEALIQIIKKFATLINFEELGITVSPKKSLKYIEDRSNSKKYFLILTWFFIFKYSGIYFDKHILRVLRY
ncbi:dymeclin [Anaeramoeba flamelloides]|uniref:Dymeclin n=1 Tax=Anaeramoeba flamelloides TaxID=1746091 RepID=A0ABQ8XQG1_9EUKA|nr:dymeclin [Anaeramoeba flamelloides]